MHTTHRVVLAATLQEQSPFVISTSLLTSTNIVLPPFMSRLLTIFRAVGVPSMSKYSLVLVYKVLGYMTNEASLLYTDGHSFLDAR